MDTSFKTTVNGQFVFTSTELESLDIVPIGDSKFHILKDGHAFHAEVITTDFQTKLITIKVNGNTYDIKLEDHYDQLIDKLGLSKYVVYKVKDIKAPMPGLVIAVSVEVGQAVQRGDALLILEAMKMENVLKSPGDGVVKAIFTKKGEAVEKGHILIEME